MALPFSALALLGNGILQSLASLKYGNLGGRNVDLLLGAGVAADAGGAALDLKGAKAHQLHLLVLAQSLGDDVDHGGQGSLSILLGQACLRSRGID